MKMKKFFEKKKRVEIWNNIEIFGLVRKYQLDKVLLNKFDRLSIYFTKI